MAVLDATRVREHVLARLLFSPSRALVVARRSVALALVVLGLAQLRTPFGFLQPDLLKRKDIVQEYAMARAIRDGLDSYAPMDVLVEHYVVGPSATQLSHPTPHPPTLGLLFLPFSLMPFGTAALLWLLLELVCLFAAVRLLGLVTEANFSLLATVALCAALLNWYPLWVEMALGQLTVPLLALLAGSWWAARSGRISLSGALVGVALLLKPLPWPLLLFFAGGSRRRGLAAALGVVGLGYLAVALLLGPATILRYVTGVLPEVTSIYRASWRNIALTSVTWKLFDSTSTGPSGGMVPPLVYAPGLASVASVVLPVLLALTGVWAAVRVRDPDVGFSVLIGVSILIGPVSWPHYLVLGLIPAAVLVKWLYVKRFPARQTNWMLLLCMLLAVDWVRVATLAVMAIPRAAGPATLPFALAQLPWLTGVAAILLTVSVARLPGAPA